ncbi:uncharacterized protein LOC6650966 [Drosophila willistoni]|nr:uncharacterized protein LOC6650966 [Drosophila willistoni]
MMKRKTSEIWCFFRAIDDTYALCNICKAKLSYKTTTTNLSKHMNRMHPNVSLSRDQKYRIQPRSGIIDRNRGKPRNPTQEMVLLEFIKKHPNLLQNPCWENRNIVESLWAQLTSELNCNGPPQKDVATWKKALKDWKRFILKKVEKNEMHNIPFETSLSSAEVTIAKICRLNEDDVSDMIINASDEDDMQEVKHSSYDVEDVVPEEDQDHSAMQVPPGFDYYPEETKTTIDIDPLYLQNAKMLRQSNAMQYATATTFDTTDTQVEIVHDEGNSTQSAIKEFCTLYKQKLVEDKRHHLALEQLMAEKNALKRKLLEIEQRKLSLK